MTDLEVQNAALREQEILRLLAENELLKTQLTLADRRINKMLGFKQKQIDEFDARMAQNGWRP